MCLLHQEEELSYICLTCQIKLLCYKCIKSNKHAEHEVKIIKKAFDMLVERVSLIHL
jgi:hypothetical protein